MMRSAPILAMLLALASPAAAQHRDVRAATERSARIVALRAELDTLHTSNADFAAALGAQAIFYGCVLTTLGSVVEIVSQEISTGRWRFVEPPFFVLLGAGVGAVLAAIGVPLLVAGLTDGGRRRRDAIDRELRELSAPSLELAPVVSPDGASLVLGGRF